MLPLLVGATIIFNSADGEYYVSHRDDPEGHPFSPNDDDANFFAAYSDYHRGYSLTSGHVFQRGRNAMEGVCVCMSVCVCVYMCEYV